MAHGGYRPPKLGHIVRRDDPRPILNNDRTAASLVFMVQDHVERALAHDTDAYRVRHMLDSRDLWTVVPDMEVPASTECEREYFDDIARIISAVQSKRQYLGAQAARRSQIQRARAIRSQRMKRTLGRD